MTNDPGYLNGDPTVLQLDRVISELRRGRAIELRRTDGHCLVAAAEMLRQPLLERLRATGARVLVVLTPQRAAALGIVARQGAAVALPVPAQCDAAELRVIAGSGLPAAARALPSGLQATAASAGMDAMLRFAKAGRLLPALMWIEHDTGADASTMRLDIEMLDADAAVLEKHRLERVSEARVPLADAVDSRIVMFRDEYTLSEHVAIIVGKPQMHTAVPVRLHSACLTGDLLGSLRCDCGEQLRTAVARIAELGGGVLLYLDQEGRGIGLTNKLRAYALQDEGLDTLDADQHLGFLADERSFRVAAVLLRELGVERVELLTNNPQKISALRDYGIDVTGRRSLIAAVTEHNERYLRAKRERAGHLVEESGG